MSDTQKQETAVKTEAKPAEQKPTEAHNDFERLLQKDVRPIGVFEDAKEFAHAQRVAKLLCLSAMMPEQFRGEQNIGSVVVIVDISQRLKLSPLLVAQQIYSVYGKVGFSAQFVIAVVNSSKKFGKIRYDLEPIGPKEIDYNYTEWVNREKMRRTGKAKIQDIKCVAWALERDIELPPGCNTLAKAKESGIPVLEGPPVTVEMAVKEGWWSKDGSKWQNMPELMLRYRAAAFFCRLYAPEATMGLPTVEELQDTATDEPKFSKPLFGSPEKAQEWIREKAKLEDGSTVTAGVPPEPAASNEPPKMDKPVAAEPEKPTPPPPTDSFNGVKAVRGLCENAKVTADEVLSFLKATSSIDDNVNSFEEVQLLNPRLLKMVAEQWTDIHQRILQVRPKTTK